MCINQSLVLQYDKYLLVAEVHFNFFNLGDEKHIILLYLLIIYILQRT